MKYIKGQNRSQTSLFPVSLNDAVTSENEVRLIDAFVDKLNLPEFGFKVDHTENGRPAYHPADLLKLYIYGYLNKVRSSRDLEKECSRNIEVMWLLKCLKPDHNTIANFRRDNPKAIKKVFRETVRIARFFNLIGGTCRRQYKATCPEQQKEQLQPEENRPPFGVHRKQTGRIRESPGRKRRG